ncbi:Canalicular multispecific organic anion transporter 1 [Homalodisca vitripennis]|nr:Canalicular multispecific organic anion transporter 1 [Homalodisca vitripennis]
MKLKDERVKLVNEVLSGIKVLKMYAWEASYEKYILKIREEELSLLRTRELWNASTSFFWLCSSFMISLTTFGVFVLIDDHNVLTPEIAFVSSALINVIRYPISQGPIVIQGLIQVLVAIKRINKFMNADELDLSSVSHGNHNNEPMAVESASFSWISSSPDVSPVLRNITLRVLPGKLVAVVGAVGSGKSSLVSAFLGEMIKISGHINTLDSNWL